MERKPSKKAILIASAVLAALSYSIAEDADAKRKKRGSERCYGIAEAGKNDCQTKSSSCAGTSVSDNQPDAYIYVRKGNCERIVGGSLRPDWESKINADLEEKYLKKEDY